MQLQLAREAAIEAKTRVSVFRGELYLHHCRALKEAEDADDVRAVPKPDAQGVCAALHVRWLHPVLRKEAVQAAFEPLGSIKHVQMCIGPAHAPKTAGPLVDYYNYAIVTYRDQSSAVAARGAMDDALVTFDTRVRAETLTVSFAAGEGDDESDDDEPVFPAGPDDPESDGLDDDSDFDDF